MLPNIRCEISIRPTSDQFLKALAKAPQLTQVRFMPTPLIPEQRTAPYLDTPKSGSFFPVLESLRARANLGVGCPFIIEELAPKVAPGLGEQTDDVLHELGSRPLKSTACATMASCQQIEGGNHRRRIEGEEANKR